MARKKLCQVVLLCITLFMLMPASAEMNALTGQTIQITTRYKSIMGKPTWVLILRDEETGEVLPYMYDVRKEENFWIALSNTHSYRVTSSTMTFGPFAIINNYCHLVDGVILGKSMIITLGGTLTPNRNTSRCRIMKYYDVPIPVVNGLSY
jgi:hypothetical protein